MLKQLWFWFKVRLLVRRLRKLHKSQLDKMCKIKDMASYYWIESEANNGIES
jgi:hypothetical protein